MAKKTIAGISLEAIAANAAGEAQRERAIMGKEKNNEKQKRFRESMKVQGFKQVLLWAFPCPADVRGRLEAAGYRQAVAWEKVKIRKSNPAVVSIATAIHEKSMNVASSPNMINNALQSALYAFVDAMGGREGLESPDVRALYEDLQEALKPFGFTPSV